MSENKTTAELAAEEKAAQEAREQEFQKKLEEMAAATLAEAQKKADGILQEAQEKAAETAKPATLTREQKKQQEYMKETVKVKLFKDGSRYKDDVFVAVNGIGYQIQRGVEVEIPRFVAQVLEQSMEQDQRTAILMDEKAGEFQAETARRGL